MPLHGCAHINDNYPSTNHRFHLAATLELVDALGQTPWNRRLNARLKLEALEVREVPASQLYAVGAASGAEPIVRVLDSATGEVRSAFLAYDPAFRGGVNVALADVDGDEQPDLIAAPASNGGPHVRVFTALTGVPTADWFAYDPSFTGGVNVAAGDTDGDGVAEVLTGTGAGGGPVVRRFTGWTGTAAGGWLAGQATERNGVQVQAVTGADAQVDALTWNGTQADLWNGCDGAALTMPTGLTTGGAWAGTLPLPPVIPTVPQLPLAAVTPRATEPTRSATAAINPNGAPTTQVYIILDDSGALRVLVPGCECSCMPPGGMLLSELTEAGQPQISQTTANPVRYVDGAVELLGICDV
jgi:hypothetical protein